MASAIPAGDRHQLIDIDLLMAGIAAEGIVETQGAVFKVILKTLCLNGKCY